MKTITFYSYKGGVGRTLVVANVAKYLAQFGLTVVALDLDLEAPGLWHKFALDEGDISRGPGVADYIAYFLEHGSPPPDLTTYVTSVEPPPGGPEPIKLISAGDAPSASYWDALSRVDWHKLLYSPAAPGVLLFEDLKARIEAELAPDYLLIDARTGMTEMGGIATSLLADVVVTLTLNTREHLEGIRSVLRSINKTRRANGDDPVQLDVALARLPTTSDDAVRRAQKSALDYLTRPADDPIDTLTLTDILVLHTEPSLQEQERLLIGAELGADTEQPLLADYLRLFARFIPLESLAPRVKLLVDEALGRLLEDPLSTERALQVLARYTGHPEALRALIRFYRVRKDDERMLAASARLWEVLGEAAPNDEDLDLVWTAIREGFAVTWRYQTENVPLDFILSVWRTKGESDIDVGLRLVRTLDNFGREQDAVQCVMALFQNHPDAEAVGETVVWSLSSAGRIPEAIDFAQTHANAFAYDPDYLTYWGEAVAQLGDLATAVDFLEDSHVDLEQLRDRSTRTLLSVLRVAGRDNEASALMERALAEGIARRDFDVLFSLAEQFQQRGPSAQRHYESRVRIGLPDIADQFLEDVRIRNPGWRAARAAGRA